VGVHVSQPHLKTDVVLVGAGPAGLACAIRLARESNGTRQILVLEKSGLIGGHLLSGAVLHPDALRDLLTPEEFSALPMGPAITKDTFHALTPSGSIRLPFVPPKMRINNLPLISANALGRALAGIAEKLGVEILLGQTADSLLWEKDRVIGVQSAEETILADTTVLAEGPAGLLSRELFERHPEMRGANLQTHGIGLKELIEIPAAPGTAGTVAHTFGYPLGLSVYGGGFIYHVDDTHVALGLALGLDYTDPAIHPHECFRRWKRHPLVQRHIVGGKVLEYGARLVPEGGIHSLCKLEAPGVFVIGDSAGLVDTMELKGLHLAVESGMAVADAIQRGDAVRMQDIPSLNGIRKTANYRAAFRAGLPIGMVAAGLAWLTGGRIPWGRIPQRDERTCLTTLSHAPARSGSDKGPLDLGMDSDLYLAHLRHREGAEHIEIRDVSKCRECFELYAAPCTRFCPALVYEATDESSIRIRPENCVQCRCCTLKCPFANIDWRTPQHGVGPNYQQM